VTLRQPLVVTMDPRVEAGDEVLRELRAVQQDVEAVLADSAQLAEQVEHTTERVQKLAIGHNGERAKVVLEAFNAAPRGETAAEVNADLASLATDLESADARPTAAHRQLLAEAKKRLEAAQARWLGPLGEALRKTPRG
jgi:septation ring formation regulator EzrA